MNSLNILSGGAAHGLVASLAPAFRTNTGFDIKGEFGAVGGMADKLRNGVATDIIILTKALVAKLAEEKLVVPFLHRRCRRGRDGARGAQRRSQGRGRECR